jgi:hypothetical protein
MRPLSEPDLIRIWELGARQHPIDRALTILTAACPESAREELESLTVGLRDARLFSVRERIFGPRLQGLVECPECHGQLEFSLNVADLCAAPQVDGADGMQQLNVDGYQLRFRLPNSLDLAAIAGCEDVVTARQILVRRCVVQACQQEAEASTEALPEAVMEALAEQMQDRDSQAEVRLNFNCTACGHRWQTAFDIVTFFWAEIQAQAKRLLYEVHTLARAYGWREADILSISPARRQLYLEMVT